MTYKALARKWRPTSFETLIGQTHVCAALTQALAAGRVHHAYLFTGTRGVGKTTIARLLSQALNCERGVSPTPCGVCANCQAIMEGNFVDLLEVDAASRTRVEETRALLENVPYAPVQGRYKVYLIDEVHMLSAHSYNALLKTLEEPPPHVKFLLATTDPQRLPATILSRCIQFHLRSVAVAPLAAHLGRVLTAEGIAYELEALDLLAHLAQGSVRDALSLTEQAASMGPSISYAMVCTMAGLAPGRQIATLLGHLIHQEGANALDLVATMAIEGVIFETAVDQLLALIHRVALCQQVPQAATYLPDETQPMLAALAMATGAENIQLLYQIALIAKRDFHLSPDPRSGFEMLILRLLAFQPQAVKTQMQVQPISAPTRAQQIPTMPTPAAAPQKVAAVTSVAPDAAVPPRVAAVPPAPVVPAPAPSRKNTNFSEILDSDAQLKALVEAFDATIEAVNSLNETK